MEQKQYIKIIILSLGIISVLAFGEKASFSEMEAVRDASLLELDVLQDWHPVATDPPTQQKVVAIILCGFENGRKVRIPVSYEYDVWEQQAMKKTNDRVWQLDASIPDHVNEVSLLSFQEGDKDMKSYSSRIIPRYERTRLSARSHPIPLQGLCSEAPLSNKLCLYATGRTFVSDYALSGVEWRLL